MAALIICPERHVTSWAIKRSYKAQRNENHVTAINEARRITNYVYDTQELWQKWISGDVLQWSFFDMLNYVDLHNPSKLRVYV